MVEAKKKRTKRKKNLNKEELAINVKIRRKRASLVGELFMSHVTRKKKRYPILVIS